MKKIKWLGIVLVSVLSLVLAGCSNASGGESGGNSGSSGNNGTGDTKVTTSILSAGFDNAAFVASTQLKKNNKSRSARAVGDEVSTVVVVNDDGTVNYDALGFSDEFKSKLKAEDA